jgi:ketosteroid isomerase-like protein
MAAGRRPERVSDDRSIEIVRGLFDALGRGDIDTVVSHCDPDVEFASLLMYVEGAAYRGHDGVRRFFADQLEAWEIWDPRPERFEAAGDVVLVTGRSELRGKGSGADVSVEWGYVVRLRGGKVLWGRVHSDLGEAEREFEALQA